MTYQQAAAILSNHSMEFRPSATQGKIEVLSVWTMQDGTSGEDWEQIDLNGKAIFAWLGY